VIIIRY